LVRRARLEDREGGREGRLPRTLDKFSVGRKANKIQRRRRRRARPITTRLRTARAEFELMKPSAILINCARGGVVDEAALAAALREGRIAGAGVDVLSGEPPREGNPLLSNDLPNLIVTPHVAWASREAQQALADQLIANIEAFVV